MAISEDLATDIDIIICMWIEERKIGNLSWGDRCALRKYVYKLIIAEKVSDDIEKYEFS